MPYGSGLSALKCLACSGGCRANYVAQEYALTQRSDLRPGRLLKFVFIRYGGRLSSRCFYRVSYQCAGELYFFTWASGLLTGNVSEVRIHEKERGSRASSLH